MLIPVRQRSTPPPGPKVWVGEFAPTLTGLTLSIPPWRFYWPGGTIDLPATTFSLSRDPVYPKQLWLYVVPTSDGVDNYHLDEVIQDGEHSPVAPEPFPGIGPILLLWGTVPPQGEPELYYLAHEAE